MGQYWNLWVKAGREEFAVVSYGMKLGEVWSSPYPVALIWKKLSQILKKKTEKENPKVKMAMVGDYIDDEYPFLVEDVWNERIPAIEIDAIKVAEELGYDFNRLFEKGEVAKTLSAPMVLVNETKKEFVNGYILPTLLPQALIPEGLDTYYGGGDYNLTASAGWNPNDTLRLLRLEDVAKLKNYKDITEKLLLKRALALTSEELEWEFNSWIEANRKDKKLATQINELKDWVLDLREEFPDIWDGKITDGIVSLFESGQLGLISLLEERVKEGYPELADFVDFDSLLKDGKINPDNFEEKLEEVLEETEEKINEVEVIGVENAKSYLEEHDPDLSESIALLKEYGITEANVETLATLLKRERLRGELYQFRSEIETLLHNSPDKPRKLRR